MCVWIWTIWVNHNFGHLLPNSFDSLPELLDLKLFRLTVSVVSNQFGHVWAMLLRILILRCRVNLTSMDQNPQKSCSVYVKKRLSSFGGVHGVPKQKAARLPILGKDWSGLECEALISFANGKGPQLAFLKLFLSFLRPFVRKTPGTQDQK